MARKPTAPSRSAARPFEVEIRGGRLAEGMSFEEKVWAMTVRIPPGKVTTYGDLARALGTRAYRAVGAALGRNPFAPGVPCHRVVGSDGRLTGYTAAGGVVKKTAMLKAEGVGFRNDRVDLAGRFVYPDEAGAADEERPALLECAAGGGMLLPTGPIPAGPGVDPRSTHEGRAPTGT